LSRKILYYFPHLVVNDVVILPDGLLKPYCNEYKGLGGRHDEFNHGSLLELAHFKSGELYNEDVDISINKFVELIKFSYFTKSPSILMDMDGFISSETFDMFSLLETNEDRSFEHKISVTNGMYEYLYSADDFLISRKGQVFQRLNVKEDSFDFSFTGTLELFESNPELYSIIHLYNKAWDVSPAFNGFLDKPVLAKASIEMLIKYNKHNKRNFVHSFFDSILTFVEEKTRHNKFAFNIYEFIKPHLDAIKNNVNDELLQLKNSRDNLVHDGIQNNNFVTLPFYLVWFPIYFAITVNRKQLSDEHVFRLLSFLCLCKYPSRTWNDIDYDFCSAKMTHVAIYKLNSNIFPKINLNVDRQAIYLESIKNWLNES
jgi:hypothetical protein